MSNSGAKRGIVTIQSTPSRSTCTHLSLLPETSPCAWSCHVSRRHTSVGCFMFTVRPKGAHRFVHLLLPQRQPWMRFARVHAVHFTTRRTLCVRCWTISKERQCWVKRNGSLPSDTNRHNRARPAHRPVVHMEDVDTGTTGVGNQWRR